MKKKWKCNLHGKDRCRFMFSRYIQIFVLICGLLNLFSCKDETVEGSGKYNPDQPVAVSNILPESGGILTAVVIEGKNFGADKTKVQVFFNEREAVIVNVVNEFIYAIVPKCTGGDNTIKVVVDGQNQGVLQDIKFNYIVSSKVTTVASEFTTNLTDLSSISVDNKDNLIVFQEKNTTTTVKLYSIKDNAAIDLIDLGMFFQGGCFSRDYKKYYIQPISPRKALVVVLNKLDGKEREMIYDTDKVAEDISEQMAMTVDDNGFIYTCGTGDEGSVILKINPLTHDVKKLGTISIDEGTSMAFNPKDKYIYMSVVDAGQIIRFDSRKETLNLDDWEWVTGSKEGTYQDGTFDKATFTEPRGIECDDDNNLYVADYRGPTIRRIDLTQRIVSTFAGKQGPGSYVNGSAETARFNYPWDVAVTSDGIVYVLEDRDHRLRCVAVQ